MSKLSRKEQRALSEELANAAFLDPEPWLVLWADTHGFESGGEWEDRTAVWGRLSRQKRGPELMEWVRATTADLRTVAGKNADKNLAQGLAWKLAAQQFPKGDKRKAQTRSLYKELPKPQPQPFKPHSKPRQPSGQASMVESPDPVPDIDEVDEIDDGSPLPAPTPPADQPPMPQPDIATANPPADTPPGTSGLPADMEWVYNHPALSRRAATGYRPAPSQGAENLLRAIVSDDRSRIDFFKKAQDYLMRRYDKRHSEEVDELDRQEQLSIKDLKALVGRLVKKESKTQRI